MKLRVKTTKALRGPSVAVRYANFMKVGILRLWDIYLFIYLFVVS